jgi:phosphoglucosamine mutase
METITQTLTPLITFGTDGIRGPADQFPFNDYTLLRLGYAIALWAREKYCVTQPRLLIGMDTRLSCERIKKALTEGLLLGGAAVVDAGIIPTPGVCALIKNDTSFSAGVMISASHNLYTDNGIKLFDAIDCKLSKRDEDVLLAMMNMWAGQHDLPVLAHGQVTHLLGAVPMYVQFVTSYFRPGFLKGRTIALDLAHGATAVCADIIFKQLGAKVVMVGNLPTGRNINDHCGALHPESLQELVMQIGADAGFAFDGDGDRIVAVNRHGEVRDGDDILYMLLDLPTYKGMPVVVGTVVSNQGLALAVEAQGKKFVRTAVGDKYIAVALKEHQVLLGGENSGHVILKDYLLTGDGIFVALKVLEVLCMRGNWAMQTFVKFPQTTINIEVAQKKNLSEEPFASIIAAYQERIDGGRLLVRYSGTEPLLRIMAEAQTSEAAGTVARDLAEALRKELST